MATVQIKGILKTFPQEPKSEEDRTAGRRYIEIEEQAHIPGFLLESRSIKKGQGKFADRTSAMDEPGKLCVWLDDWKSQFNGLCPDTEVEATCELYPICTPYWDENHQRIMHRRIPKLVMILQGKLKEASKAKA